jgi:dihydrofolate reductase
MTDNLSPIQYAVIAAVDNQRGYAKDGQIPWHFKEDFEWFKKQTMGHACVMGRKTYEDINQRLGDKAKESVLPGRQCFVVSSTLESLPNATVVRSITEAALRVPDDYNKPIFIIGGGRIFTEGVSLASTVYLTVINESYGCDKVFPVEFVLKHFPHITKYSTPTCDKLRFLVFSRTSK